MLQAGRGWRLAVVACLAAALAPSAVAKREKDDTRMFRVDPSPRDEALVARWQELGEVRMADTARHADNNQLSEGECTATFKKGIFVPLVAGGGAAPERNIGFVFMGEGEVSVDFPLRSDAWSFGNYLVNRVGEDPADVAAIARQVSPYSASFEKAVVITADPFVDEMLRKLDPVGGGVVEASADVVAGGEGVDESYVVTDRRGRLRAFSVAGDLYPRRREALDRAGFDPAALIRLDRMLVDELGMPGERARLVAEFKTDKKLYVASAGRKILGGDSEDNWLSCMRDGWDAYDLGLRTFTFAHGRDDEGNDHLLRLSGTPWQATDNSPGLVPIHAENNVTVMPGRGRHFMDVKVESRILFRSERDAVRYAMLELPRHEALDDKFALASVTLDDGTPITWLDLTADLPRGGAQAFLAGSRGGFSDASVDTSASASRSTDGVSSGTAVGSTVEHLETKEADQGTMMFEKEGQRMRLLLVFPEPVDTEGRVRIRLDWRIRWKYSHYASYGQTEETSLNVQYGVGTGLKQVLPLLLPTSEPTRWNHTTNLKLPGNARLDVAMSGRNADALMDEDGWLWVGASGTGQRNPAVAIGKWSYHEEPPQHGLPAVAVHMEHTYDLEGFGPEVRRVAVFLKRFLSAYPGDEIEIFEAPGVSQAQYLAGTRNSSGAFADLMGVERIQAGTLGAATQVQEENPFLAQHQVARQVVRQYFEQEDWPTSARDRWIAGGASAAYASFYVRAAMEEKGFEAFFQRMDALREKIEEPSERGDNAAQYNDRKHFLSLTGYGSHQATRRGLYGDYAEFVLAMMLRQRVGDQAFFDGFKKMLSTVDGAYSTADLQVALEQASGQDLADFFDYWVHGGFVPGVKLSYTETTGADGLITIDGCIETDVPFGSFDLPVSITDKAGERTVAALVDVDEGRGRFTVPGRVPGEKRKEAIKVEADPEGMIVAYARKVRQVDALPCQ